MPVETETSTTSSGSTTTVGATVRDGGPGGMKRTLDVFLHIESAKYVQVSAPSGAHAVDADRLSVWWKDLSLPAGGTLSVSYAIKPRPGVAFEGPAEGVLVVCDRSKSKLFLVRRFCICPHPDKLSLFTLPGKSKAALLGAARPSRRKRSGARPRKAK